VGVVIFFAPIQIGPGTHPASYTMGTGSFQGVTRPGHGVDHPSPSSVEVKEIIELYLYPPPPLWPFVACYRVNFTFTFKLCRSQWPRRLRRRSAAARLLRLWVRVPPGAWMSVCYECCVLSRRGLCVGLITRPEKYGCV
jgi:hypothetical protein